MFSSLGNSTTCTAHFSCHCSISTSGKSEHHSPPKSDSPEWKPKPKLLDLIAAFDNVNHNILLHCLHSTMPHRAQRHGPLSVHIASRGQSLLWVGAPQDLVLGPTLFTHDVLPHVWVIGRRVIHFHCYAEDTQLHFKTNLRLSAPWHFALLTTWLGEIEVWVKLNFFAVKCSLNEAILLGNSQQVC